MLSSGNDCQHQMKCNLLETAAEEMPFHDAIRREKICPRKVSVGLRK